MQVLPHLEIPSLSSVFPLFSEWLLYSLEKLLKTL